MNGYRACRRDEVAVRLANLALRLATPAYREGMARWRDDGVRFHAARRALDDLCTAAVIEDWKWWRPGYSSGRYDGLARAVRVLDTAASDESAA